MNTVLIIALSVCIIAIIVAIHLIVASLERSRKESEAFIEDYRKWASMQCDLIVNGPNKLKSLF